MFFQQIHIIIHSKTKFVKPFLHIFAGVFTPLHIFCISVKSTKREVSFLGKMQYTEKLYPTNFAIHIAFFLRIW